MPLQRTRPLLVPILMLCVACGAGDIGEGADTAEAPVDDALEVLDDVGADASQQSLHRHVPVGSILRTTAAINFRTGPGVHYERQGILPRRARVVVLQAQPRNRYYNVRYGAAEGWASGSYLRLVREAAPSEPTPEPEPKPEPEPTPNPEPKPEPEPTPQPTGTQTGGSGGALQDVTFQSYSNGEYTSRYHLYAAGLDWSKPVGLMVYCDGSAEYGLKNPEARYLLAGADGLINVAKRNNMVLLTPFAPNPACGDGDGSCWYMGDPPGYARWSADLIKTVQSRYNIAKNRVALGGYSSGAQWLTEYFAPGGHADDIMVDGVAVAISYGGSPKVSANFTPAFRANVHFNWNTGDRDSAYTSSGSYGVKAGHAWYSGNGFQTSLDVIEGMGHSRSDFGRVMEAQIKAHLP